MLNVWAGVSQRYGLIQWKYLSLPTEPEAKLDSSLPVSSFFSLSHNGSESELPKQWWYCAFHALQQNESSLRKDRNVFICLRHHKILVAYEQKKTKQTKKNVPVPVIRMNLTAVRAAWAVVVTQISLNDSPVQSNTLHGNVDSFLVFRQLVAVSSDGLSLHEFYIRTQNGAVWLKEFTWRGSEDHSWNAWDSSVPSQ